MGCVTIHPDFERILEQNDRGGLPEQNVVLATQWAPERFAYIAWNMTTGKTRFTMPTKMPPPSPAIFYKLDFSSAPDGTWFALAATKA